MRSLKYIPSYTVEDYNQWEGHWELIDGVPSAMSPSPTMAHQLLAGKMFMALATGLLEDEENSRWFEVFYALDWIVDNSTVVRPDVILVKKEEGKFISKPPHLVIEILSPSSAMKDRHVKFEIYEEQGVKYYIIADPDRNSYNIYLLNNGRYEEHNDTTTFSIHDTCSLHLDVAGVIGELSK